MSRGPQDATSPAELFDLLWESLADVLGTAATATLLRRAIKRTASHSSWSGAPAGLERRPGSRRAAAQTRHIQALRRILALDGHRIEVARDGPGGVELALATVPEVAFIDLGLPGIDGYEVGRRIRATLGTRLLLVAVTAYGQELDRRRSSGAGFDAHLVRPVGYGALTRLVGRVGPGDA